ncbi:MAG: hypothetical protein RLN89_05030 [Parvibaculum sp.]
MKKTTSHLVDWAAIKHAYQTAQKVEAIATQHGTTRHLIVATARAEGWPLRKDRPKTTTPEKTRSKKLKPKRVNKALLPAQEAKTQEPKKSVTSQALRVRLTHLVERQIREIEERIEEIKSAADHERDARTLSNLTRTFEKLIELRRAANLERQTRTRERQMASKSKGTADGETGDNIRGELERRLARLAADGDTADVSRQPDT